MNTDDRSLIDASLNGRPDAFGELVSRYQDRLYNSVYRIVENGEDAADVVQEAFVNAYQSLASFKGDAEFFTWMYRIAFNAAISLKRKRRPTVSLDASRERGMSIDVPDESANGQPGDALERSEILLALERAMAQLSAEHRSVLVMKDIDGLKYEQIAAVMVIPVGTVRSRLHRARLELRDLLVAEEHSPRTRINSEGEGVRPHDHGD